MRRISVLLKNQAKHSLPSRTMYGAKVALLCVDYELRQKLKNQLGADVFVDQKWLFHDVAKDIRDEVVEAIANLNEHAGSFWWQGQIASKSSSANLFFAQIVFFFVGTKILTQTQEDLVFIVDSPELGRMIEDESERQGIKVLRNFVLSTPCLVCSRIAKLFKSILKIVAFGLIALRKKCQCLVQKISSKGLEGDTPKILIRTWVTQGNFTAKGFEERVFGPLGDFLQKSGKDVILCPMFFNLNRHWTDVYGEIEKTGKHFIVSEELVGVNDVISAVRDCLKIVCVRYHSWKVRNNELKAILHEAIVTSSMDSLLFYLNLQGKALATLKKKGISFEAAIYPCENNAPEKAFILGVRQFYPETFVVGFAHTTFYKEQLAFHLGVNEYKFHPLADRIVTNGKKPMSLFADTNFPRNILYEGPNLRFNYIHRFIPGQILKEGNSSVKDILVPLSYSYSLAFDILDKLQDALGNNSGIRVFVRNHPLLDENRIRAYALSKNMEISFANEGSFLDWMGRVAVVVTTGASITTLESVICGIPVIRVAPDFDLHYDCYHDTEYPISMINTGDELVEAMVMAEDLRINHPDVLIQAAQRALRDYFNEPNDHLMSQFIPSNN